ncbi:MAG TPA: hypothetical protein VIT38_07690 [Allosphingosinicella sp.]
MSITRLLAFAVLAATAAAPAIAQTDAEALRMRPIPIGPQPRACPERGAWGFCFYDSGWRPAADNPFFQPLRAGDPTGNGGPLCSISNRRDATLAEYSTEETGPAMRLGGRLIRFMPVGRDQGDREVYRSPQGRLIIDLGAEVARADESDGRRARLTFIDRRGRAHVASVRIDCGV